MKSNNNENHTPYGDLYAQAKIGHWEFDVSSQIFTLDDISCSILGLPQGSRLAKGEAPPYFVSDTEKDSTDHLMANLIENGEPFNTEIQLKRPDGQLIWVMVAASAYIVKEKCLKVSGLTQDLTRLKALEENLHRKNQLLNVAQVKAGLAHWQWDHRTNMVRCSENMSRLLKTEKESPVPLSTILKHIPSEDVETVRRSLEKSVMHKRYQSFIHRLILNGSMRYIKVIGKVNTDADGNITNILGISQDVTDQQEFQARLIKKNHLLNLAEEKASMGHWYWKTGTKTLLASKNLLRLFGQDFDREDVRIKHLLKFVHPEDATAVRQYTSHALSKKRLDRFEFRIVLNNGHIKILRTSGEVYLDGNNEIEEILGIFQDVTEQKDYESHILKNNYLLNLAEEKASMGHWHTKSDSPVVTMSQNLENIFGIKGNGDGITLDEMLQRIHPEDREQVRSEFGLIKKNKAFKEFMFRIVLNDGRVKTLFVPNEVQIDHKEGVSEILGVCQDITRQRAEELKFRNLLDSAPNPTFIINYDRSIVMANKQAQHLFGYTSKELLGQSIRKLFPKRFYPVGDMLQDAFFSNPTVQKVDLKESLYMRNKQGEEIPVHITLGPVQTESGLLVSWVARDITQEKLAESLILQAKENLERLTKELRSQNHQLEDFSYITTHNLRAPVNNLNALLKLYKTASTEAEKSLLFEKLERVTGHLTLTLDTLVDSLKVQTNQSMLLEKLSLNKVLAKTKEILMAEIEHTGASLHCDFSEVDHVIYVRLYLESLFQNLINNSLKYRDPERSPVITISSKLSNGTVTLLFSDNGLGMDLQKYGHNLFRLNKVFHNHPEAKGVGLYMTKTQIESVGGDIRADSEVGKGTTFKIVLKNQLPDLR
ncbi:PAS domain-containing sensor histidine kinase [Pseudozobellia thermophila]|uniref:PAS domain-containing sensor histidine kinase n=1 Tax=Pseudozobellia thermophila TaxID=192903 RepID=UPI00147A443B|nr:PAS domain-containing sensor histidine kinase [Pseudozobellia thermophila]